ncbi:hypothetical protein [Mycobacterium sp. TY815]|uniref:hypothetical protein n=1 Tax=Mycobacterium sp. TY815 TaxID=3050581 RepID=UPI00274238FD|nr:hypothetical protein [Mycobacterium sp. TY815]MDP7703212.1 hypothetical protein [Mycobacterium sp. TY815]
MTIPSELAAYLAGAIDSDGSIGIRRSTYAARVKGDARQATYSERICLKQVTPEIPRLLKETFGGSLMLQKPSATQGRPLYYWEATNKVASDALAVMLPYLRVKRAQAENALALRASKSRPRSETHAHRQAVETMARWGATMVRRLEVSADTIAEREAIYARAKELNRVGI